MAQGIDYGLKASIQKEDQPSHSNIQHAVFNLENVITQLKLLKSEIRGIEIANKVEGEASPVCGTGSLNYVLTYATSSIEEKHNAMLDEIHQIRNLLFGDL